MRRLSLDFLEQVLRVKTNQSLQDDFLDKINQLLKAHNFNNLLGNEELYTKCYKILQKQFPFIQKYFVFYVQNSKLNTEIEIDGEDVLIIATLLKTLEFKMSEIKDIYLLISILITYNYLGVDYRGFINIENINRDNLSNITGEIRKILLALQINTITSKHTAYYEKQLLNHYTNGIKKSDIESVYECVEAIERGIGFYPPTFLNELTFFLYFVDNKQFINVLNTKEQTIEVIFLLESFSTNEKLNIIIQESLKNKWAIYELFRQIIDDYHLYSLSPYQVECLIIALNKLTNDINFYKKLLLSFRCDRNFNIILGNTFISMDKKYLDTFLSLIIIDKNNSNVENNRFFMINLLKCTDVSKIKYLCKQIYLKWEELLSSILTNNEFLNHILYSDYYYSIIHYLILEYDNDEKYYEVLREVLSQIEDLSFEWKNNSSKDISCFFIGLTKLYTLSIVFRECKLSWSQYSELIDKINNYLNNQIYWLRYYKEITMPTSSKLILENFKIYPSEK